MTGIDVDALTAQAQQKFHLSDDETAELVFPVVELVAARVEQDVRQQIAADITQLPAVNYSQVGMRADAVRLARGGSDAN